MLCPLASDRTLAGVVTPTTLAGLCKISDTDGAGGYPAATGATVVADRASRLLRRQQRQLTATLQPTIPVGPRRVTTRGIVLCQRRLPYRRPGAPRSGDTQRPTRGRARADSRP